MNSFQCPICHNNQADFTYKDYLSPQFETEMFSSLKIIICPVCGFGFLDRYIGQNELNKFYASQYQNGTLYQRVFASRLFPIRERALAQLTLINSFIPHDGVKNILDIGSGYGDIFDIKKIMFPKSRGYAFEIDNNSQRELSKKEIVVFKELFSVDKDYSHLNNKFDVIIMSHVLEHYNSADIAQVLIKLAALLTSRGILFIEVPCDDMRSSIPYKDHAPHLSFFSVSSLNKALEAAGIEILFINTCGPKINEFYIDNCCNGGGGGVIKFQKNILRKIPFAKKVYRNVIALKKYYKLKNLNIVGTNFFYYGPDRIWIRVVGRIKEKIEKKYL
jgi:SAM-dependent methyltransferase